MSGFLFALFIQTAFADILADFQKTKVEGKTTHKIEIDNDTFLLNKNDGFYTSGLRYTQQYEMPTFKELSVFGWRIGQELYTASDIKLPPALVVPPNHPYAGWLYGGFFKETYRVDGSYTRVGFDIGCLGVCAGGEWTQTNFHRLLDQPLPQGWSKQVKNELGIVLYGDIAPVRWAPASSMDVTPALHGRLGNIYTDVGASVTLRAGQLNLLPDQPTTHGFLRINGRAIGYNATLQGGYFSNQNPHTVTPKRWIGEVEVGMLWERLSYSIGVSLVRRSNDIRDLSDAIGAQNFARLQFSYRP